MDDAQKDRTANNGLLDVQALLLGRLRQAAKSLIKNESFEAVELDAVPVFEKALSAPKISEAWSELNRMRAHLQTYALRPVSLLLALGLTLGDLHLSLSAEDQNGLKEIWDQETLAARLAGHYKTALDSSSSIGNPRCGDIGDTAKNKLKGPDQAALAARAECWLGDLLPYAVGCVLNDAKVNMPSQAWESICMQDYNMVLGSVPLTERGRQMVRALSKAVPKAKQQLEKRLRQVFELDPESWDYLCPNRDDAVFYLRAHLWTQQQNGGPKPTGTQKSIGEGEAESRFQQALRELIESGFEERVNRQREAINKQLEGDQGRKMASVLLGLLPGLNHEKGLDDFLSGVTEAFQKSSQAGQNQDQLISDFWVLLTKGLAEAAREQGTSQKELVDLIDRLESNGSLTTVQAEAMRNQV